MRTLSAAPRVFFDADSSADSSASKRISLSIPFSRPICSMTAISSRFTSSTPLRRLRQRDVHSPRAARPRHLGLEARLRDIRARDLDALAVGVKRQPLVPHLGQRAVKLLTAGDPATHPLADRPAILALLPERPIEPGRRHLEIVRLP